MTVNCEQIAYVVPPTMLHHGGTQRCYDQGPAANAIYCRGASRANRLVEMDNGLAILLADSALLSEPVPGEHLSSSTALSPGR